MARRIMMIVISLMMMIMAVISLLSLENLFNKIHLASSVIDRSRPNSTAVWVFTATNKQKECLWLLLVDRISVVVLLVELLFCCLRAVTNMRSAAQQGLFSLWPG